MENIFSRDQDRKAMAPAPQERGKSPGGETQRTGWPEALRSSRKYQAIPRTEQERIMKLDSADMKNAFLQIKMMSGARTGEMLALRWENVDFENGTILISEQLAAGNQVRIIRSTKNYRNRTIPMVGPMPRILKGIHEKSHGRPCPRVEYDFVFCDDRGYPLKAMEMIDYLRETLGRSNVSLHNLRSTAATVMYQVSGEVEPASLLLGHADTQITMEHYIDTDPDTSRVARALTEYHHQRKEQYAHEKEMASGDELHGAGRTVHPGDPGNAGARFPGEV